MVKKENKSNKLNKISCLSCSFILLALPPAEVFSFCFHTALTELAATSEDVKTRDHVR